MHRESRIRPAFWTCVALVVATVAAFLPALSNGFVDLDDGEYVTHNPWLQQGLSWASLNWTASTSAMATWSPPSWLSYMLDWQCYGPHAAGHRLTSILIHAASAVLAFAFFSSATGAQWRSALVAVLFAVHPLRVESVAWVAE